MTHAVLIVNKPSTSVETYRDFLTAKGYRVFASPTLAEANIFLNKTPCSVAFISSDLLDSMDSSILRAMKNTRRDCKFVLITTAFDMDVFVEALNGSIFHECLVAPPTLALLENVTYNLVHMNDEAKSMAPQLNESVPF